MACPSEASLRSLAALGSVYVGEVHGTEQSPALVGCLADYLVAQKVAPFTVSLELPPDARDFNNPVWSGKDGRTSRAMAALVKHLLRLEQQKKLTIDFQIKPGMDFRTFDHDNGMALHDLAAKGRLIAYGGNVHAQRRQVLMAGSTVQPAGAFIGPTVTHVMLDADADGNTWDCTPACGIHPTKSFMAGNTIGALRKGDQYGYDFVFVVGAYSASTPLLPSAPVP